MSSSLWLDPLQKNFARPPEAPQEPPTLWLELEAVTRRCCEGQAGAADWMVTGNKQFKYLRDAYKKVNLMEQELEDDHPARRKSTQVRKQLLALRASLSDLRRLTRGSWASAQQELKTLRTGLLQLETQTEELLDATESLRCRECKAWSSEASSCEKCGGLLEADEEDEDDEEEDDSELPPDYAELRELADSVGKDPSLGPALRQKALGLIEALKESEASTRELLVDDPDTPVDEMVAHLHGAAKGLTEMANWPKHRNRGRLERGWDLVVDHLASFEELLEESEEG